MAVKTKESSFQTPASKKTLWFYIKKNWDCYVFLLPALTFLIIFNYAPMYGIQVAFKDFRPALGIWGSPWVGLDNFSRFVNSFHFKNTVSNTIILSVYGMIAGFPFPILLALLLNEIRSAKYKKFVQTVTYAPNFISTVVLVGMLTLFLNPSYGVVGKITSLLEIDKIDFMASPSAFRHVYVWSGIWQGMGFGSIIYLAVLTSVDPELHEAAIIDGATKLKRMWHINLPTLWPTVTILLILNFANVMNVAFEKVFIMQNALNMSASEVLSTYVYRVSLLRGSDIGLGSAVGIFTNTINAVLLIIVNWISRRVSETSLW